jgi:hypothetical protein
VDAYVAAVAGAREQLRAAWRPLADAFAGLTREGAHPW